MWGGHGYGFKMLEPYFPVMRTSLSEALDRYDVRYLVVDREYVDLGEILEREHIECQRWRITERLASSNAPDTR